MAFVTLSPELSSKSFTGVENKFITKYLPVLDALSVKVYLYGLYLGSSAAPFTVGDLASALGITEEQAISCFEYLEEFELVRITCRSPFEAEYLRSDNVSGTPKRFKSEKYADFAKSVQSVIKGRMISTNEYREYFYLIEEYGFEQNALLMIINYCVNMKGDDIRMQYIKKVAKSFAAEGAVTAKKVDEKLARFTSSTPALLKIFASAGISRKPDVDDDRLYKKWTSELGFDDEAIAAAARNFKAKSTEKLDEALCELYRNKKFDAKEIGFYCKTKNSVHAATIDIARALGVYMQNAAPYIENYVSVWCDRGYELATLKTLASYCFVRGKRSFEDMDDVIKDLYAKGIISDKAISSYIEMSNAEDELLKKVLSSCGLTRKVTGLDREFLSRWREWEFTDAMILKAAELSAGKNNPTAYMNGILSAWKASGTFTPDKIGAAPSAASKQSLDRGTIERHYAELRQIAESRAEKALADALADEKYGRLHKDINSLGIALAFAESRGDGNAEQLAAKLSEAEKAAEARLEELGMNKDDFTPHYRCKICKDTGYDANGNPCRCLKEFMESFRT